MENLESKYVSDYSNKNINRYTCTGCIKKQQIINPIITVYCTTTKIIRN